MMQVGYIGLGIMGRPMALNLLAAGYPVAVWARRPEGAEPLKRAGAEVAPSASALAAQSDVVFLNVSETADVEEVLTAPGGVLAGARPGLIVVDHSTISATATRTLAARLAEQEVTLLDAPVSGGEQGAIDGTLSLMVGGDGQALERIRPLLEVVGGRITHLGEAGAGQVAKACNQLVVAQTMAAVGEAYDLARAAGVDPVQVREALLGGLAYSKVLEVHGQKMLKGDYRPGFRAALHAGDLAIVRDIAAELDISLPGTERAGRLLDTLVAAGRGDEDSAALVTMREAVGR